MLLVFAHVPKTGGTAINEALRQMKPAWYRHRSVFDDIAAFGPAELARSDYCSGHYTRRSLDIIPGTPYRMTVLRDPVERVLSHIRFCRAHKVALPVPAWRAAQEMNLNELFFSDVPGLQDHFGNWAVRAFLDPSLLRPDGALTCCEDHAIAQAIAYLDRFDLVGVYHALQTAFDILCADVSLGVPITLPRRRDPQELAISPEYREVEMEPMTDRTLQRLRQMTALDGQLFAHASEAFERRLGARKPTT